MDVAPTAAQPKPPEPAASTVAGPDPARPRSRSWFRDLPVLVLAAVALTLVVRLLLVQAFYIPSGSMEPTLEVGDRVLVSKVAYVIGDVQRGDVIVFDGRDSFAAEPSEPTSQGLLGRAAGAIGTFLGVAPSERDFVKRVIGLGGDHVVCCDASGRLTVNDVAVDEPYVLEGDPPSSTRFDVIVPAGRLWVMGDHRSDSADSRSHLGDPGGGTVPVDHVIGKVVLRFWPLDRTGSLPHPTPGDTP